MPKGRATVNRGFDLINITDGGRLVTVTKYYRREGICLQRILYHRCAEIFAVASIGPEGIPHLERQASKHRCDPTRVVDAPEEKRLEAALAAAKAVAEVFAPLTGSSTGNQHRTAIEVARETARYVFVETLARQGE